MSESFEQLPEGVAKSLDEFAPAQLTAEQTGPSYTVDPVSKVPASKHHGKLWKSRLDAAKQQRRIHVESWDEAIRYYNNDQSGHRDTTPRQDMSGNRYFSRRRNNVWSETENIVYANTRAIMPALYAKNPQTEFTCINEQYKPFVQQCEDLVNVLANMRQAPGLNLKTHAKQNVLSTELCNLSWIEVGYTFRDQSTEGLGEKLQMLSDELVKTQEGEDADVKRIREIEGQLMALEEELTVSTPPGPFVRFHSAHSVVPDPDCCMPDFSDAKWMAIETYYPTDYLNAKYATKNEEGQYMSLYEPTHVFMAGTGDQDDLASFKLFDRAAEAHSYGYGTKEELKKAGRTKCWRIYDRILRRVYLYADNKWDVPIWAEADPYGFADMFPLEPLYFNTTVGSAYARANVTYYLDQQDAVNEIHDEFRRARQDVKECVLYDNKFNRDTVESWIRGGSNAAYGVDVPDGKQLKDMILEKPNAMLRAAPLFDIQRPMQSIDRISGVSDVLRNVQFKTNTTNKAIENYNSSTQLRLDEKIDAIEDFCGRVMYKVAFLCAQFMPAQMVEQLLGERGVGWQNYAAVDLRTMFTCQAIGGSTQKPTSAAKKQQALEMAEVLSKLGQFAPTVVAETILKLFDGAFDELELPPDAFERILQEAQAVLQRGNSVQGAGGEGMPTPESPGTGPQDLAAIAMEIDQWPPAAKAALGNAISQGAPIAEAVQQIAQLLEQQPSQQGMM